MTNPAVEQRDKQIKEMMKIAESGCMTVNCNYSSCALCHAQALYDAGYLLSQRSTAQAVQEAVKKERERIRQEFNKRNAPDAKDWQTGTGGKLYKVLLFTKKEWCDFWQAQRDHDAKKGE